MTLTDARYNTPDRRESIARKLTDLGISLHEAKRDSVLIRELANDVYLVDELTIRRDLSALLTARHMQTTTKLIER